MSPTLKNDDNVFVNRANRSLGKPLSRFDIVALVPPFVDGKLYSTPDSALYTIGNLTGLPFLPKDPEHLRRVIALPGETVVLRSNMGIFIDGRLLDESTYTIGRPKVDLDRLGELVKRLPDSGDITSFQDSNAPLVVPEGSVFVMPDNRNEFVGSETWGFVEQSRIVGVVEQRLGSKGIIAVARPVEKFAMKKVDLNDQGVKALEQKNYHQAIQFFKSALAIDREYTLARENLSIAYNNIAIENAGTPDTALDSLHKAMFLDPDNPLTIKNLNGILKRMGKDPKKYEDRIKLAEYAEERRRAIDALVEYREALKITQSPKVLAKVSQLELECRHSVNTITDDGGGMQISAEPNANAGADLPASTSLSDALSPPTGDPATNANPAATSPAPVATNTPPPANISTAHETMPAAASEPAHKPKHEPHSVAHDGGLDLRTDDETMRANPDTLGGYLSKIKDAKNTPPAAPSKPAGKPKLSQKAITTPSHVESLMGIGAK
jgi:signal peptidase I, bacterial type